MTTSDAEMAQDLAWQLVDDMLDEEGFQQLEVLLTHSQEARQGYIEAMQLHVGLMGHFGQLPKAEELVKTLLDKALKASSAEQKQPPVISVPDSSSQLRTSSKAV